jgi:FkbM family methyltransferase
MRIFAQAAHFLVHPGFRADPLAALSRLPGLMLRVLRRRPYAVRLSASGEQIGLQPNLRYTNAGLYLLRDLMEPELRGLERLVTPGGVFVDIGANIGAYTLRAASLVGPAGKVIAVEPGQAALAALRPNIQRNGFEDRVTVAPVAMGDTEGEAKLYHVGAGYDPQAFSLLADATAQTYETVRLTTLDHLAAEQKLTALDCVKIDAEGVELAVLKGGERTLSAFAPLVVMEMNSAILSRRGDAADGAWGWLKSRNYTFWRMTGGRFAPIAAPPADFCNIIAAVPGSAGEARLRS